MKIAPKLFPRELRMSRRGFDRMVTKSLRAIRMQRKPGWPPSRAVAVARAVAVTRRFYDAAIAA